MIFPSPLRVRWKTGAIVFCVCCLGLLLSGCGSKKYVPSTPPTYKGSSHMASAPPQARTSSGKLKGTYKPYTIRGETYHPMFSSDGYQETGIASWYGRQFHGKRTANGEVYDMYKYTAAHRLLPMKTKLMVENLENGRTVQVMVNDRGPFVDTDKRIIDLSYAAAKSLGMDTTGLARVRIHSLGKVKGIHNGDLSGTFYVQLGAFTQASNARTLADKLKALGYSGTRIEQADVDGRTFWRVQAGVFSTYSRAQSGKAKLKADHPGAFVVAR
ncbi:MAG: septal ring lytic transglycosylase RlpA family protein [Desulfovibrio sp.]|uniref:septal ring lytic transglycosylase RlpA family protein n=1 Tax=Desulfovibrio sp. 7SRBS1 TaxID=3378064 RepID=UPI003B40D67D